LLEQRDRGLVMPLLVGQLAPGHEQVLGAKQAHAHRAVLERVVDLLRRIDVREQHDIDVVARARRQVAHRLEPHALGDLAALLLPILRDRRRRRIVETDDLLLIDGSTGIVIVNPSPTTAGISWARAMIAVCEVLPPAAVMSPATAALCKVAVSAGDRSYATTIASGGGVGGPMSRPSRLRSTRSNTNSTSLRRSRRYGSSI